MRKNFADAIEREALIFNVQKYNTYDGPGVRTLIFFKGCPLRCQWCSNPEGLERKYQIMVKEDVCTHCGRCVKVCPVSIHELADEGKHAINRDIDCLGCRKCEETCFSSALSVVGEKKSISELMGIIEEDRAFYDMSGGGVTVGGGEALMQLEAVENLLMVCKQRGINTALETCGYAKQEAILRVARFTDLFLFDIKHMNSDHHFKLTGVRNEMILENLTALLRSRFNVKVRMPLLKNVNDSKEEIRQVIRFVEPFLDYKNFKGIDLLPYHRLGVGKYKQLGMEYPLKGDGALDSNELDMIEGWIKEQNCPVSVIRH